MRVLNLLLCILWIPACGASQQIVIGSKSFSEQVLLAEILAQQVERNTELSVDRRFNLGGTFICDRALRSGQLDAYIEYTGTALIAILQEEVETDREAVFQKVASRYRQEGLEWLPPLGFNNTFVILIRGADARRLGVASISEIRPYAPEWQLGFGYEFLERQDGFQGLVKTYDLHFRKAPVFMELGLLYSALAEGRIDLAAGNSTDALIDVLDLAVLEDDRHYFPPYDAAVVVRQDTLRKHLGLREVMERLSGTLSEEQMRRLNYAMDQEGRPARQLAAEFLDSLPPAEIKRTADPQAP